jgi:cytoskeletal protein CcmA (bactofilin family)
VAFFAHSVLFMNYTSSCRVPLSDCRSILDYSPIDGERHHDAAPAAPVQEKLMFKKAIDEEKNPVATQPAVADPVMVRTRSVSVIGPTLVFKGELSADEDLVIQGTIEGTIAHHKKNLTVGKEGRVKADIHAASVAIEGHVDGDIHGDDFVELAKSAVVTGNIFCARIKMADGARFNGSIEMGSQAKLSVAEDPARDPARTHKLGA